MRRPADSDGGAVPPRGVGGVVVALLVVAAAPACSTSSATAPGPSDEMVGEPTRPSRVDETSGGAGGEETREGALWYRIAVEGSSLRITLRLLRPAESASFFLPNVGRRSDLAARTVTLEGARGPGGPVAYEQIPEERRIDVETAGLDWVELSYRIDVEAFPEKTGRPMPDVAGGSILGYLPALLIVPSKRIVRPIREIPVEIHAPAGWAVRATWPRRSRSNGEAGTVHGYVARDIRALRDAFFVAGPELTTRRAAGGTVTVVFQSGSDVARGRFTGLVERLVGAYRRRYEATGRVLVYARPLPGAEEPGVRGTAKRNGFVVHLPRKRPLQPAVRVLVAHEAFHLWNGHRAIPTPESDRDTRWFEEGVTHYVALKTAYEAGVIGLETVRRQLAKSAYFYRRNPASSGGEATRLDLHRLPYDRGVLLAIALDAVLHRCGGESRSIDGWMRNLLEEAPAYYDPERLRETYLRTAGEQCPEGRRAWSEYVTADRPLAPAEILADIGLHYLEASTVDRTRVLPLERERPLYESLFDRTDAADGREAAARKHGSSQSETSP